MSKAVDERKKRKALRRIRKAAMLAEQGLGPALSDWEVQFLEEVEARIDKFGSAFHDPDKGGQDEALSSLQHIKLREIDKKARGKAPKGFSRSSFAAKKQRSSKTCEISEDIRPAPRPDPESELRVVADHTPKTPKKSPKQDRPPHLRVIQGGAEKT